MASSFKRLAPLLNRVLIRKVEVVNKSPGGIILQDNSTQENVGEVVEVGAGTFDQNGKQVPVVVKKGDTVLLPDYGGSKVKLQTGEFWLYRDSDIVGILKKD
jgi:chaperonin GroES